MRIAAIILAAGESRRMGRAKALLPFRGGTFLSVLFDTLLPYCSPVVAVFGFNGEIVAEGTPAGMVAAINRDYRLGMLSSLQTGLRALADPVDRVMFTLVDHPAISRATVAKLIATRADIAIPRIDGKRGHPVLVSREIAREFLAEPATSKVRDVIDRHAGAIRYLEVDDPGICDDVDNPALYEALLAREAARAQPEDSTV
ncbi:MAG: nucleotidyltransferase family protein [Bryobacteraceae bacterium]